MNSRYRLTGQVFRHLILSILVVAAVFAYSSQGQAENLLENLVDQLQKQNQPNLNVNPNNGNIVIDPNAVICLPPFVKVNNQCVCPIGKKKVGNTCVPINIQILCQAPFVPDGNGNCVCPVGKKKVGNTCVPIVIQILCQAPFVPNNNNTACVCPIGKKKVGNTCVPVTIQILCKAPFVPNNSNTGCVCPAGKFKLGNTCIGIPNQCPVPFVKKNNQCVCPDGLEKVGNKCVQPQVNPQCQWPFVYSSSKNSCVCARGYRLNNSGNKCIRKQTNQSLPRSVVADIQTCLGRLGYEAGPADGAIGRKTRSAWSSFRIDEGLQGRPNRLSDEVTQDRLFQACARLNEAAAQPETEEEPSPSAQSTGTNFDPDSGYPPIQCASEAVAILLQGLLDQEDRIGICGEVCVPIPDGMTPQQVEGTSSSVNWCRHCTKIGDNGLLCTAEPKAD